VYSVATHTHYIYTHREIDRVALYTDLSLSLSSSLSLSLSLSLSRSLSLPLSLSLSPSSSLSLSLSLSLFLSLSHAHTHRQLTTPGGASRKRFAGDRGWACGSTCALGENILNQEKNMRKKALQKLAMMKNKNLLEKIGYSDSCLYIEKN